MNCYEQINELQRIFLYKEPATTIINFDELKSYLAAVIAKRANIEVIVRPEFITYHLSDLHDKNRLATELAKIKVCELRKPVSDRTPLRGEIEFERFALESPESSISGLLYDGYKLQTLFRSLLSDDEHAPTVAHIIFTNRLLATFHNKSCRYHARVILCGYPSIISTTGVVEAPAKPREFYQLKQTFTMLGQPDIPIELLKKRVKGDFIDYNDTRLTEVMKGYVLQAIFYHIFGTPFCENKDCRLFNAHWQHELIHAQINSGKLCDAHSQALMILK
jgi:hypothetical protein